MRVKGGEIVPFEMAYSKCADSFVGCGTCEAEAWKMGCEV